MKNQTLSISSSSVVEGLCHAPSKRTLLFPLQSTADELETFLDTGCVDNSYKAHSKGYYRQFFGKIKDILSNSVGVLTMVLVVAMLLESCVREQPATLKSLKSWSKPKAMKIGKVTPYGSNKK